MDRNTIILLLVTWVPFVLYFVSKQHYPDNPYSILLLMVSISAALYGIVNDR